jgi:hypothetical protein
MKWRLARNVGRAVVIRGGSFPSDNALRNSSCSSFAVPIDSASLYAAQLNRVNPGWHDHMVIEIKE